MWVVPVGKIDLKRGSKSIAAKLNPYLCDFLLFILAKEDSIDHGINTDKSRDDLEKSQNSLNYTKMQKIAFSKMKFESHRN